MRALWGVVLVGACSPPEASDHAPPAAWLPASAVTARFDTDAVRLVRDGGAAIAVRTAAWGRHGAMAPVVPSSPRALPCAGACAPGAVYAGDGLTETVRALSSGVAQSWAIAASPPGEGPLWIEVSVAGADLTDLGADQALAVDDGGGVWAVSRVAAWDATGRSLPARVAFSGDGLRVEVDDAGATYPIAVDPLYTTAAWTYTGSSGYRVGVSVAAAGDVNGDGWHDMMLVARGDPLMDVLVFHGSATGLGDAPAATLQGVADEGYGAAVDAAGDVNGDGYDDIVVGAFFAGTTGRAYVYYGSATGLSATGATELTGEGPSHLFGRAVAGVGDVNDDGYDDVAVGAPWYDVDPTEPLTDEGRLYLYHGGAAGLHPSPAYTLTGESPFDRELGMDLTGGRDFDDDGYDDVVVQAGYPARYVRVLHGQAAPGLSSGVALYGPQDATSFVAGLGVGDVDGDGFADVLVGAQGPTGTTVVVYGGGASGISAAPRQVLDNPPAVGSFTYGGGRTGDADGDGYDDLIACGSSAGSVLLQFRGSVDGLRPTAATEIRPGVGDDWCSAGVAIGDVDDDGYDDVMLATQFAGDGLAHLYRGREFVGCGDGRWDQATEACDDGNFDSGDGCSDACAIEPGYTCFNAPDLNTGSADGARADVGADDLVWRWAGALDGTPTPAQVSGDCAPGLWVAEPDFGRWVNRYGCGTSTPPSTSTFYSATFSLMSDEVALGTVIDGTIWADNSVLDIWVNGVSTGVSFGPVGFSGPGVSFGAWPSALYRGGENTITVEVFNAAGAGLNPDGLLVVIPDAFGGGSECLRTCGDGTVDTWEQCDDGNHDPGDDCSPLCLWEDNDHDGYTVDVDCDDDASAVNPGATEVCDGIDNDCVDGIDVHDTIVWATYAPDLDEDGYGADDAIEACSAPDHHVSYDQAVLDGFDCDDDAFFVHPGASETCATVGVDDDCDDLVDGADDSVVDLGTFYTDDDEDGFGDPLAPVLACERPDGAVDDDDDCDDTRADVHPDATEACNEVDDDCDDLIDEDDPDVVLDTFYPDADGDGYGAPGRGDRYCDPPTGHVRNDDDCDDTRADVHPGAVEVVEDGVDQDCDTIDPPNCDRDADGWEGPHCGGEDCDDADPDVHPDATEVSGNGIDDDCDGDDLVVWYQGGCDTTGAPASGWLVLLGLLGLRRKGVRR